jgi:hypothetical protein
MSVIRDEITTPRRNGSCPRLAFPSRGRLARRVSGTGVRTLVFDVPGTVVDASGSIAEQVTAALAGPG